MEPLKPSEGLGVLHLFCKSSEQIKTDLLIEVVDGISSQGGQVIPVSILGHKADLAFMVLSEDWVSLREFQTGITNCGLQIVDSYVSLTEISEYATGVPDEMRNARLYPELPPEGKTAWCFYPMSKRRNVDQNWFTLDFEKRKNVSPEEYLKMIRLKTSILFGAAAFGGSRIGGASLEEADELRQMATNIGLGFQIWDDYLDATVSSKVLGKDSGSDIRQGKRTLLVIEALNRASKGDCKRLLTILDTDDNKDADIAEAVAIMEQCGALNKCHDLATEYLQRAEKVIYKYSDSKARQLFLELLEYMVNRGH